MDKILRIYLDLCTFNRPFDYQGVLKNKLETEAKLFIQQGIITGSYELVWSYILEYENSKNKLVDIRNAVYGWKKIAKVHCVENEEIVEYAEKLKHQSVRTKDALHIACSVYTESDYLITTDKKLFHLRLNEIKIVNPLTFLNIVGG